MGKLPDSETQKAESTQLMTVRPRFSLSSLLMLMTIVALVIALWQQHILHAPLQKELHKLRDEVGRLTIDDHTKPHAIEVATGERNHWRWRVYIPEKGNYGIHCYSDYIPQEGLPATKGSGGWSRLSPGEHGFDLWIDSNKENNKTLDVRFSRSNGDLTTLTLREQKHDWIHNEITQSATYGWQTVGKRSKSFGPQNPVVLLRLRPYSPIIRTRNAKGKASSTSSGNITEPCEGLMIWIDQKP